MECLSKYSCLHTPHLLKMRYDKVVKSSISFGRVNCANWKVVLAFAPKLNVKLDNNAFARFFYCLKSNYALNFHGSPFLTYSCVTVWSLPLRPPLMKLLKKAKAPGLQ